MTRHISSLGLCIAMALSAAACNRSNIEGGNGCDPAVSTCVTGDGDGGTTMTGGGPGKIDTTGKGGTSFNPGEDGSNGVKKDKDGNIVLVPGLVANNKPIIWVANSAEGSVSKVDTRTMTELARYYTYPGGTGDPSRTTVGLSGDVVVANRAWKDFTPATEPGRASAVKIAGDINGCVDRNGNGKIDTYQGSGPIPAQFVWQAGQPNSPDECVLWLTQLNTTAAGAAVGGVGTRPRAAGFDAVLGGDGEGGVTTQVYIGLHDNMELIRLDAKTGKIIKRINVAPVQPYGLVLDKDGAVWIRGNEGSLGRVEARKDDKLTVYSAANGKAPPCPYGITADAKGRIYTAGGDCVSRFDPKTESWETLPVPGATSLRGIAVDQDYGVWIAETAMGMVHVDGSTSPMVYKGAAQIGGGNNVGAAIDFDGFPWVVSLAQSTAFKLDPKAPGYAPKGVKVGQGPYTYSDMTGYQLRNAGSPTGVYRHIVPGCGMGTATNWYNLDWDLKVPAGTQVVVRVRSAKDPASLTTAAWTQVAVSPPSQPPIKLNLPTTAGVMEVEFTLMSGDPNLTPILSGLRVGYSCLIG